MAKEAIERIKEEENKGKALKEEAMLYLKQTLKKAEEDKALLFEQKIAEANQAAEDILKNAGIKAEEILSLGQETGQKEIYVLKQTVLEKTDETVNEVIDKL